VRLIQIAVLNEAGELITYKNYDMDWLEAKLKNVRNDLYKIKEGGRNQDALEMYIKAAKKQFIKEFALNNREDLIFDFERAVSKNG
jgi:hypothetical protein